MLHDIHFLFLSQLNKLKKVKSICYVALIREEGLTLNYRHQNLARGDFPGGTVVKNPPAHAGDTGSLPGLGRSHMPQSNKAHAPQLLNLHSRAREPQLLSPRATTTEAHTPRACARQQEKPPP